MQARIFADAAIRKFNDILLPLAAISTSFESEAKRRGDTVRVPVFPTLTAASFSGDYSAADKTITGVDVSIDQHYFSSVAMTDREVAESPADYFTNLGQQEAKAVAKQVLTGVMSTITAAAFGNAAGDKLVVASTAFNAESIADLRGKSVKKGIPAGDAAIVLGPDYYVALLKDTTLNAGALGSPQAVQDGKVPRLFGFNNIFECNFVPGNSENLTGFVCSRQALAAAIRYLAPQSTDGLIDAGMVSDDESGITLGVRVIPQPLAGKVHYVTECLWGQKALDGAALVRILSA
jgi:hypothetical protein